MRNRVKATARETFHLRWRALATGHSGTLTLVPAANGGSQWAFQGKRLYRGLMDKKPGDRRGDGLKATLIKSLNSSLTSTSMVISP
ncbi:COG4315 family predicted lipoprotein [Paraburkholderia franconis]|uniref:hypothetical protein n=1 Tax=Paraburkholderia franconis TaxID=2654983 RepID=UPI001D107BB2|nr:hypothetical protein [Paraburkholderia franconis]